MTWLRELATFLRSTPPSAHALGVLTLLAWIIKAVVFDNITEPLPGMASLGKVVEGVFSAIFAGYVFYIIFALLPDYKSRSIMMPFINNNVRGIIGDCLGMLQEIGDRTGYRIDIATATAAQVSTALEACTRQNLPNMIFGNGPATWEQFFLYRQKRSKSSIGRLFDQGRFLDAELVAVLAEIDDCSFFGLISSIEGIPMRNEHMGFCASVLYKYVLICRRLAVWHDKHRASGDQPLMP